VWCVCRTLLSLAVTSLLFSILFSSHNPSTDQNLVWLSQSTLSLSLSLSLLYTHNVGMYVSFFL
jgi:hypothetical protein